MHIDNDSKMANSCFNIKMEILLRYVHTYLCIFKKKAIKISNFNNI